MRLLSPVVEVTRSLSNLIKYPFVNFQKDEVFELKYEEKDDSFVPLNKDQRVLVRTVEEVEREKREKKEKTKKTTLKAQEDKGSDNGDSFSPGVAVVNMDAALEEKRREAEEAAEQIVKDARERAEAVLRRAEEEADSVRQYAREEGISEGRQEGLAAAQEESRQIRQELEQIRMEQEQEYQELINNVERRYVDVLCSLLQKVTGVLYSDQKDILLHLIRGGIADMEPAERYTVRVSPEDIYFVEGHKDELLEKVGTGVSIDIQEEKGLLKEECIVETDKQMVDCGFKTQLANLVTTLRILAQ